MSLQFISLGELAQIILRWREAQRRRRIAIAGLVVAIVLFIAIFAEAATPKQIAAARVVVAVAQLDVADERPILPGQAGFVGPLPQTIEDVRSEHERAIAQLKEELKPLSEVEFDALKAELRRNKAESDAARMALVEEVTALKEAAVPPPQLTKVEKAYQVAEVKIAKAAVSNDPEVTVMICDGETCTEHPGTLISASKSTGLSLVECDGSRFESSPNAKVTAVTANGSSFEGRLVGNKDHVATILVQANLRDVQQIKIANALPLQPLRMTFQKEVQSSGSSPVVPLTCYTADGPPGRTWCQPCNVYHDNNGSGDGRMSIEYTIKSPPLVPSRHGRMVEAQRPCTTWMDNSGKTIYVEGYQSLDALWERINRVSNNPPQNAHQGFAASGPAGTIQAKAQIQQAIGYFKKFIGNGNSSSLVWGRNGSTGISLLANGDWSAKSIFGTDGRIELASPNASNLPTRELAFGYRIRGSDVVLAPDPITLKGFADQLMVSKSHSFTGTPSQFIGLDDALEIYWCIQMFKDIFAMLHPSADLMLPDQIAANAVLNGETLTVNFDKPVTVKLVWLFTFNLVVKRVVITESNVHVDFSGSRFVKSRDFAVQ